MGAGTGERDLLERSLAVFAALALAAGLAGTVAAQDAPAAEKAKGPPADREPEVSVTRHTGTFGGQRVAYTATAGEIFLRAENGTARAAIFSISYVREPRDPGRPVTFLFNGGPGSGSVWLHMGAFGPRRVAIPSDGTDDGGPPFRSSTIPTACSTSPTSSSSIRSAPASAMRSATPTRRNSGA